MIRVKPEGVIEWIGALLVLLAFTLLTAEVWSAHQWPYLVSNVVGSICIAYGAFKKKDIPPVALNIIWLLVALIGLLKLI